VDGVLTDGGLVFSTSGEETKRFHVHDGLAMVAAPGGPADRDPLLARPPR
jgi:3-deoxy-D-manno-octulosonate 8-phosphate phosphatase KdsC-like HAD superfamily phosphatase